MDPPATDSPYRKRGRPLESTDTVDPSVQRRRDAARRGMQRLRAQRVAQATIAQRTQEEAITALQTVDDAEGTLNHVGLRVSGLAIPQDPSVLTAFAEVTHEDPVEEPASARPAGALPESHAHEAPSRGPSRPSTINHFFARQTVTPFPPPPAEPPHHDWSMTGDDDLDLDMALRASVEQQAVVPTREDMDQMRAQREEDDMQAAITASMEPPADTHEDDLRAAIAASLEPTLPDETGVDGDVVASIEAPAAAAVDGEEGYQAHLVDKLHRQLVDGFHGCAPEAHADALARHEAATPLHWGLDEVMHHPEWPSTLRNPDILTAEHLSHLEFPRAAVWKEMFCGVDSALPDAVPKAVCLHKSVSASVPAPPRVVFDVDSFLGFPTCLSAARKGIWCQFTPLHTKNITQHIHLKASGYQPGSRRTREPDDGVAGDAEAEPAPRAVPLELRKIPHFSMGVVEGQAGKARVELFILFPLLPFHGDKFKSLNDQQYSQWFNRIFLPCLRAILGSDSLQHLPGSFRHARASARAPQKEGRLVEGQGYAMSMGQAEFIQPQHLQPLWTMIQDRIRDTPGLHHFGQAQLFFSAKDAKLKFKTDCTGDTQEDLLNTIVRFEEYLSDVIDLDVVPWDRFYVDLAKEVCQPHGSRPLVYLWRQCCQREYLRWLYDGVPFDAGSRVHFYHQNLLKEATNMTAEPPGGSPFRRAGLSYSQFYATVKGPFDAAKHFPFQNDGLEELALDPGIAQGARSILGGNVRKTSTARKSYLASKDRVKVVLLDTVDQSYSAREEHRLRWDLVQRLRTTLRETRPSPGEPMRGHPGYVWALPTSAWYNFVWRNIDKYCTGFELTLARCQPHHITWEQTKTLAMFLRGLRLASSSHRLSNEPSMWWNRAQGEGADRRLCYGMGMKVTLPQAGYAWLLPRLDFGRLEFLDPFRDHTLFGNTNLMKQYLRRGGQMRDFFGASKKIELALTWLEDFDRQPAVVKRLVRWTILLVLEQLRVDVLSTVAPEIRADHKKDVLQGREPFCYEYVREITQAEVHLIKGNKVGALKRPSALCDLLFGIEDGVKRDHWEHRAFRKLHQQVVHGLRGGGHGARWERYFHHHLMTHLFHYHWVLPYPCSNALTQTTKQGERMWYSIDMVAGEPRHWQWVRGEWRAGRPPPLPEYSRWDREQWDEYITQERRRRPVVDDIPANEGVEVEPPR